MLTWLPGEWMHPATALAIAGVLVALIKEIAQTLRFRKALEGTRPAQRPAIIHALSLLEPGLRRPMLMRGPGPRRHG